METQTPQTSQAPPQAPQAPQVPPQAPQTPPQIPPQTPQAPQAPPQVPPQAPQAPQILSQPFVQSVLQQAALKMNSYRSEVLKDDFSCEGKEDFFVN